MKKSISKITLLIALSLLITLFSSGCDEILDYALDGIYQEVSQAFEADSEVLPGISYQFSDNHLQQMEQLSWLYDEGNDYRYVEYMTIDIENWQRSHIYFGGHDELGRTLPALAYLSSDNIGSSEERNRQTHNPSGWNQNQIDGTWVHNRGHLIAYSLSFNFDENGNFSAGELGCEDNPINLFTQTAHSNQRVMTRFEDAVREMLRSGCYVVYKASPVFRGDELMARGIWLQGLSRCGEVEFSVYIFNRQPGVDFDYETGASWAVAP